MKSILSAILISFLFILFLSFDFQLSSCTKTNTVYDTTRLTIHDTTILKDTIIPSPSKLSLLTGKRWEFDSVYSSYSGPGTGTLIYVRGAATNAQNLDNYYNIWTIDGYLLTSDGSSLFTYKWNFLNSDSTYYKAVSGAFTDYGRILKLDATHVTFYDSTNNALDIDIITP